MQRPRSGICVRLTELLEMLAVEVLPPLNKYFANAPQRRGIVDQAHTLTLDTGPVLRDGRCISTSTNELKDLWQVAIVLITCLRDV